MVSTLHLRRLDALRAFAMRLAEDVSGGLIGEALDVLFDGTPARAATGFRIKGGLEQVAERRLDLGRSADAAALRRALSAMAERATLRRASVIFNDLRRSRDGIDDAAQILALGATSVLATPLLFRQKALGALVVLFDDRAMLDEPAVAFVETVAAQLAPALTRDDHVVAKPAPEANADLERMAEVGLLTESVARELRGPSGALSLQLEEQRRLLEQIALLSGGSDTAIGGAVAELAELTSEIETAAARLNETVSQLSSINRTRSSQPLDLQSAVKDALAIARPHLERRGIQLLESYDSGCVVMGRRDNLIQVVLNLIFNAADACQSSTAAPPEVRVSVAGNNDTVSLIVEDSGPGVPDDQVARIFTPFYSSNAPGLASGFGLKICSDVVSSHGGHIEVVNASKGGAVFRALLPRLQGSSWAATPLTSGDETLTDPNALKQILVIDDDPIFSRTVRRVLKPHNVRTAATASEAEIALLDPSYTPDLVVCDVFLPGVNGNVLHQRVVGERPELSRRFVFVTGGALGKKEADYLRASTCTTLFKPLDMRVLLELLNAKANDSAPPQSVRTLSGDSSTPSDQLPTRSP